MKIEVLMACMYQDDFSIVERCNIQSDAIIINQCNENKIVEKKFPFGHVRMIYTTERGLSRSRNMALKFSDADICLICDDDIVLHDSYSNTIIEAFENVKNADLLVFNIISKNLDARPQERMFAKIKKIPFYKSYSSVHIAFKRTSILNAHIYFDVNFGTGSGVYSFAEDSLFFAEVHRNKLRSYTYPSVIADLYTEGSSWFTGFNKKYFYDTGAFLSAAYPMAKYIYMWYYPLRLSKKTDLSFWAMIKYMKEGFKGYKKKTSFKE